MDRRSTLGHNIPSALRRFGACAVAALLVLATAAQDPPYRAFTVTDGLPSNTVYCALQDQEGYMWFGTDAGASRFDGLRFQNFTTSDGLVDNEVLSIFQDSRGRIWFLSLNGKLCYWLDGRFFSAKEHPEFDRIRPTSGFISMAEDTRGCLWFSGSAYGLLTWCDGRMRDHATMDVCSDPVAPGLSRLVHVRHGDPWLSVNGSLYRITDGTPRFVRCWNLLPQGYPMVATYGDELLAYGAAGLSHIGESGESVIVAIEKIQPLTSHRIPSASRRGDIWLPSTHGGLTWVEGVGTPEQRSRVVLRKFNINTTYEDGEGNRWMNTDGHGTLLIDPAQQGIGLVRAGEDQRERSVSAVIATRNGELLFGTSQGSIHRYAKGAERLVMASRNPAAMRDRVRDLQETPNGTIWTTTDSWCGSVAPPFAGSNVASAWYFDERFSTTPPQANKGMKSLATDHRGTVIGSSFGIGELKDTLGVPTFIMRTRYWPSQQRIYAPFIDGQGSIWFETNEQLHCWRNGERIDFPDLDTRFGSRITDIDALEDGTLVIASAGNGVQLVENGSIIAHFNKAMGLPSDQCRVAVVRGDRILVATDAGAALITDPRGAADLKVWTIEQGLPSGDVQDIDLIGDDLFLATPEGLVTASVQAAEMVSQPPLVRITGLATRDSAIAIRDTVSIRLDDPLEVHLHAFTFSHPEAVRYAYRLAKDTAWTELTFGAFTLNGLVAGTHHYQLRAKKVDSPWSAPRVLCVIVVPPWYRTTWFSVALFAIALSIIVALVRYAMQRAVRVQRVQLERQQALTEERQRIAADMHDDLGADISHLLMIARQSATSTTLVDPDRSNLTAIEAHAGSMLKKIDEVIWSLDPADDRLLSSLEFLQRYTETFTSEHGMGFRTKPIEPFADHHLPGVQRRELYLLLKELLQNVVKHTDARNLRFEVRHGDGAVQLVIEDDGKPRTVANGTRNGHGLHNIRMRLENLRGEMRTEPIEPIGTRTTITIWLRWIHQL